MKHIAQCKDGRDDTPMILIGNKCDLDGNRKVSTKEGRDLAKKFEIPFLEVSAKTSINVQECFTTIVRELLEHTLGDEEKKEENNTQDKDKKCVLM